MTERRPFRCKNAWATVPISRAHAEQQCQVARQRTAEEEKNCRRYVSTHASGMAARIGSDVDAFFRFSFRIEDGQEEVMMRIRWPRPAMIWMSFRLSAAVARFNKPMSAYSWPVLYMLPIVQYGNLDSASLHVFQISTIGCIPAFVLTDGSKVNS